MIRKYIVTFSHSIKQTVSKEEPLLHIVGIMLEKFGTVLKVKRNSLKKAFTAVPPVLYVILAKP